MAFFVSGQNKVELLKLYPHLKELKITTVEQWDRFFLKHGILSLTNSILLFIIGIGLMIRKNWARLLLISCFVISAIISMLYGLNLFSRFLYSLLAILPIYFLSRPKAKDYFKGLNIEEKQISKEAKRKDILKRLGLIFVLLFSIIIIGKGFKSRSVLKESAKEGRGCVDLEMNISLHSQNVAEAMQLIKNRLNTYGVKEGYISIKNAGGNRISVQIFASKLAEKLPGMIQLEFKLVEGDEQKNTLAMKGMIPSGYELKRHNDRYLLLYKEAFLNGLDIKESFVRFDSFGFPNINMQFTPEATKKFAKITEENIGRSLAIMLEGEVISFPLIGAPILNGQISMDGYEYINAILEKDLPLIQVQDVSYRRLTK